MFQHSRSCALIYALKASPIKKAKCLYESMLWLLQSDLIALTQSGERVVDVQLSFVPIPVMVRSTCRENMSSFCVGSVRTWQCQNMFCLSWIQNATTVSDIIFYYRTVVAHRCLAWTWETLPKNSYFCACRTSPKRQSYQSSAIRYYTVKPLVWDMLDSLATHLLTTRVWGGAEEEQRWVLLMNFRTFFWRFAHVFTTAK